LTAKHPIDRLFAVIAARKKASAKTSYTAKLLKEGVAQCAKKFGEESVEVALAGRIGGRAVPSVGVVGGVRHRPERRLCGAKSA
jgi:hypothetical protein